MNAIWTAFIILSICLMLPSNFDSIIPTFISGGTSAINLSIKLIAIYGVWCGILAILEDTKLDKKLAKLISPIVHFLFGKDISSETKEYISTSIVSNFLGMGNASIPSGIDAINSMSNGSRYASNAMLMLLLLNVCPVQLIPTTVIGLISTHGGTHISSVIIGVFITNFIALVVGVLLLKICGKIFK